MSSKGLSGVRRNLRYGFRVFARAPGFAIAVLLTLALGIGANSAMFSLIDGILLKPLPFPGSERLVQLSEVRAGEVTGSSLPRLEDWNRLNSTFEAITGYYTDDVSDTTGDAPERIRMAIVAPRFLEVWGIAPSISSGFPTVERRVGEPPSALLSDRYWRTRFAADSNVLDHTISADGQSGVILGVMPMSFLFPDPAVDLWSPIPINAPWLQSRQPEASYWTVVGRLLPGVTLGQARADLLRIQRQLSQEFPATDDEVGIQIDPLKDVIIADAGETLMLLFGAVSLLLLIACTNIASLLLSRWAQREPEVAVRRSLGASRTAIISQIFVETAVLVFSGAVAGLLLAAGADSIFRLFAPDFPRLSEVGIDGRIILYTVCAGVAVSLLCGVFPAIRSVKRRSSFSWAGSSRATGQHPIQWSLVAVQITLSVTLLTGTGLLLRSASALSQIDQGFDPDHVLAFRVSGNFAESYDYDRVIQRVNRWIEQLSDIPSVQMAATSRWLPGVPSAVPVEAKFAPLQSTGSIETEMIAEGRVVAPNYFEAMQIPLLAGELCRRPTDQNARLTMGEAMVNQRFVDRYFPGRPIIGAEFTGQSAAEPVGFSAFPFVRVVGVVGDAREGGIDRDPSPTVYACDTAPNPFPWYILRIVGDPSESIPAVLAKMRELEPQEAVYDVAPLYQHIDNAYSDRRLRTVLLALLSGTALSLACFGVYATLSYVVSLRRKEIGLRMALGASRHDIIWQFLRRTLSVVGSACLAGIVFSFAFTRILSSMLFGVSPADPLTLSSVLVLVLAIAGLSASLPAIRAARVEPMRVLRDE